MFCLYCQRKLAFITVVRREHFCSPDHRELYHRQAESRLALARVVDAGTTPQHSAPASIPLRRSSQSARAGAISGIAGALATVALAVVIMRPLWQGRQSPLAAPAETPPSVLVAPPAIQASPTPARHVSIRVTDASWVSACSDGKQVLERFLVLGDTREIEFARTAVVRVGNAGGVEIAVDGKGIGPLGRPGTLRVIEVRPGVFGFLALKPGDNASPCLNY
jgi:hypothetical protein